MAVESGIPILTNEISQRVAYAESLTMGKTIFERAAGKPRRVQDREAYERDSEL